MTLNLFQRILGKKEAAVLETNPVEVKQRPDYYVELEKRLKEINVPFHDDMWIHFNWPGDNKGYDLNKEIDAVISVVEEVANQYNRKPMMQKPYLCAGGVYRMFVRLDKQPAEQVV